MAGVWTKEKRSTLEFLLKEGYMVPKIATMIEVSAPSIYNELKRCLSETEYKQRQYVKYSADAAIEIEIKKIKGEL